MKYRKNAITFLVMGIIVGFVSTVATAGDKFKSLQEITPSSTRKTPRSFASSANEPSTPVVELPDPEAAIDKAIKTPSKNEVLELKQMPTSPENTALAKEIDNIFLDKKPEEIEKPNTHKEKERVKKQKKRHTKVKTVREQ